MFTGKHVTTSHTNLYRKQTAWKPHVNRNRVHKISSNILLLVFLFLRSSVHKYWRHMRWRLSSQHPRMIKQLKVISRETTSIRLCTQRDRIYTHPKPLSNLSPIIVIRREDRRRRKEETSQIYVRHSMAITIPCCRVARVWFDGSNQNFFFRWMRRVQMVTPRGQV